jgi:citrate lyase beta subunit
VIRSFHFVPADRDHFLRRAETLSADALVYDLEDGVASTAKATARENLRRSVDPTILAGSFIRINELGTLEYQADKELIRSLPKVRGIVVPKVMDAEQLLQVGDDLVDLNLELIALVEDVRGLARLRHWASVQRLVGVGLGFEDLFSEFNMNHSDAADLVRHIRLDFVLGVKALGVQCIDGISLEWKARAALERHCSESRLQGFDAMFSIHPDQIEIVNNAFAHRSEEVAWARHVAELWHSSAEPGYVTLDGELVTPPKLKKARRILTDIDLRPKMEDGE